MRSLIILSCSVCAVLLLGLNSASAFKDASNCSPKKFSSPTIYNSKQALLRSARARCGGFCVLTDYECEPCTLPRGKKSNWCCGIVVCNDGTGPVDCEFACYRPIGCIPR